jgi:hypothetical protein
MKAKKSKDKVIRSTYYVVYFYFVHKIWGSGSLLTLCLSLKLCEENLCTLWAGRGGEGRGGEDLARRRHNGGVCFKILGKILYGYLKLNPLAWIQGDFVPHFGKLSSLVWRVVCGGRRRRGKKETSKLNAFTTWKK